MDLLAHLQISFSSLLAGTLLILDAQERDSGVYVCGVGVFVGRITLNIVDENDELSGWWMQKDMNILHVPADMSFWILYAGAPAGVLLLFLAAIIVMGLWLRAFFSRKSKAEF